MLLTTKGITAIFRKGMNPEIDSYSAFYDNSKASPTGLAGYLHEKGANDLYFCGLAADICVFFTLTDALNEGFNITLIEDGTKPLKQNQFNKQITQLKEKKVDILSSEQL